MKQRALWLVAIAGIASVTAVRATEDHSEHQPQQFPSEAPDPHAQHRPATQHEEHAQHRQPAADQPTESERAHVAPAPPQLVMGDMSNERMIELMQMEDNASVGMLLIDQVEWRKVDNEDVQAWEIQAWYGTDYNKLWLKTEGERVDNDSSGRVELLWDRIVSPWWSLQIGARHDFVEGSPRTWAAFGVQGLAPYFFEVEATMYVGEEGRTAARFSTEYDILITQRLVLQPDIEFALYSESDAANAIGSGLATVDLGLRLRYELRRELAPYVGLQWERKFGETADFARAANLEVSNVTLVAGLRAWF
jgi:copper resistance protein B